MLLRLYILKIEAKQMEWDYKVKNCYSLRTMLLNFSKLICKEEQWFTILLLLSSMPEGGKPS